MNSFLLELTVGRQRFQGNQSGLWSWKQWRTCSS